VNIPGSICGFLDMPSSGVSAGLKTTGPFDTVASPVGSNKLAYKERPEPLPGGFRFEGFDIVRVRVYELKLSNASSSCFLGVQPCEAWLLASQPSRFHMAPFPSDLGSWQIKLRHHQTIANLEAGVLSKFSELKVFLRLECKNVLFEVLFRS
jgi:hypothetical protein